MTARWRSPTVCDFLFPTELTPSSVRRVQQVNYFHLLTHPHYIVRKLVICVGLTTIVHSQLVYISAQFSWVLVCKELMLISLIRPLQEDNVCIELRHKILPKWLRRCRSCIGKRRIKVAMDAITSGEVGI